MFKKTFNRKARKGLRKYQAEALMAGA